MSEDESHELIAIDKVNILRLSLNGTFALREFAVAHNSHYENQLYHILKYHQR